MFIGQCSCAFPAERLCEGRPPGLSHLSTSLCSGSGSPAGGRAQELELGLGRAVPSPPRTVPGSTRAPVRHLGTVRALAHFSANTCLQIRKARLRGAGTHLQTEKVELVPPMGRYSFLRLCSVGSSVGRGSPGRSACDPHAPRPGSLHPEGALPSPLGTPLCPRGPACVPPPEGCGPCAHQCPATRLPVQGRLLQPMSSHRLAVLSDLGVAPPLGSCTEWMAWQTPRPLQGTSSDMGTLTGADGRQGTPRGCQSPGSWGVTRGFVGAGP